MLSKYSFRQNIAIQMLVLYLLFMGPVVLAWIGFDQFVARQLSEDVKAADLALARAISQETNTTLARALQSTQHLSSYPEVITSDPQGMQKLFSTFLTARPDINLVYRLDADGLMVYHYPLGPSSTVNTDFSFRDYFQEAKRTKRSLLSRGRISPTTELPVTTAVTPIWDDAENFLGVVATNIKLQSLSTTLASIAEEHRPEENFEIMIVDSGGRIIAHPEANLLLSELTKSLPAVTGPVLEGQSGNTIGKDETGVERLYTYAPITSVGWGVIVSRNSDIAFATARMIRRGVLVTIYVFLVLGIIFWIVLSRRVLRPLEFLASYSEKIGTTQHTSESEQEEIALISKRPDRIGRLALSLQRMEESIEARLTELSTLLQTSAVVVSSLNPKTVLNNILEQVERLMNIQSCAIVALDTESGQFRARASRGLSESYSVLFNIDPAEPHSITMQAIESGLPQQVSDTELDANYASQRFRSRSEGYRSILAVPLSTQHSPPAALLVYKPDPHVFSEQEIGLLTSFANHAAMAIENAELYDRSDTRLKEQTRRLEALIQSFQDGLLLEDLHGRVLYANRSISELLAIPMQDILNMPIENLVERLLALSDSSNPDQTSRTRQEILEAIEGERHNQVEISILSDHQKRHLRIQVFNVTDPDDHLIGRGQILSDVTHSQEIERMRTSLISTVSHELRTPLAAIKGYVTTLLANDVEWDEGSQLEFLEIIQSETDRLSDLVSDLLDMSRIEAGNLVVNRVECHLNDLVLSAANRAHPRPKGKLELSFPENTPLLYVDPQRIGAVLRNLIENATKYSGEYTSLQVSASIHNSEIVIRVTDEGPGIPLELSERIFDSFYQVSEGLPRQSSGAGLGLSICKGFVEAHGGNIWMEPCSSGTCIAFSLPIEPSQETQSTTQRFV